MRVAVLRGGRSSEHEVSLRSGAAVAGGLREAGHETIDVLIDRQGRWTCSGSELELRAGRGLLDCDAAFPVLHGPFGEDGTVQGLLECLDLPYVGPGVLAAATTIDKLTCKRLLAERGLPQVDYCEAGADGWLEAVERMGHPVWVKPSRLGSSVGIVKVAEPGGLEEAVETARRFDPRVIVEAHAEGREVECSVIGNSDPQVSVPGEIIAQAEWYHYAAKYEAGGMELVAPPDLDDDVIERIRELAREVYLACACTGLARCDFFVIDDREVLVNEINTIPGFTDTSVFAKLFEVSGISYPELCDRLLELALERHAAERSHSY